MANEAKPAYEYLPGKINGKVVKDSQYRLTAKILKNLSKPRQPRTTEAEVFAGLSDEDGQ